jgi:hypothetical protein
MVAKGKNMDSHSKVGPVLQVGVLGFGCPFVPQGFGLNPTYT